MKKQALMQLFVDELADMNGGENQIIQTLPKLIKLATSPELKDALSKHLKETQNQVTRIEKIFSIIGMPVRKVKCEGLAGILKEGDELLGKLANSPALDSAIVASAQKVEHYEIASYGTLRAFANDLDLDSEVVDLLQATLDEEGAADHKLTKIAEGGLFTSGVNQEATSANSSQPKKAKR